jgi:hypothetical protein
MLLICSRGSAQIGLPIPSGYRTASRYRACGSAGGTIADVIAARLKFDRGVSVDLNGSGAALFSIPLAIFVQRSWLTAFERYYHFVVRGGPVTTTW